jgi:hypothetical protein
VAEAEQQERARKAINRAIAIRDGLIPPPWLERKKDKRLLLARKAKAPKRRGRPPVPREPIIQIAENYIADHGLPAERGRKPSADALMNKVYAACDERNIPPPERTTMKGIVSPIFKKHWDALRHRRR